MIPINKTNYFSPGNQAISNSKLNIFLKSKELYYKMHVTHEVQFQVTPAIKIGKIVDALVSGEPVPYKPKVLKKDNPDLFEMQKSMPDDALVTETQWNEALARAQAITKEPFYQDYAKHKAKFQVILQATLEDDVAVCGMADVITKIGKTVYIDDFKSSNWSKCRSVKSWFWNCLDMGYFRQMGTYQAMARSLYPKASEIICRHVVVAKEMDNLYRVKLFVFPQPLLDRGWSEFRAGALSLARETYFCDEPVTWDTAELLNDQTEQEDFESDEEEYEV